MLNVEVNTGSSCRAQSCIGFGLSAYSFKLYSKNEMISQQSNKEHFE